MKNWFENLKFFSVSELNPHSMFIEEEKFDLNFCFRMNIINERNKMITMEEIIWIFNKISEWEVSLYYRIKINLITLFK